MILQKFHKKQFNTNPPSGWHLCNETSNGEFTLCGIAFDGDATGTDKAIIEKKTGKVTCPDCIEIIRMCRNKNIKI